MAEAPQADGEQEERPKERPAPVPESEVNPETTTLNGTPLKSILKVKSEPALHNGGNDNGRLSETGTSVETTASTTLETVTETSLKEKPKAIAKKKVRGVKVCSNLCNGLNGSFISDVLFIDPGVLSIRQV